MSMSRFLFKLGFLLLLIAVATSGSIAIWSYHSKATAVGAFRAVQQLQLGQSSFVSVAALVRQFGGYSVGPCSSVRCRFDLHVSNAPLYRLHVAPRTVFAASLFVRDGKLSQVDISLTSDRHSGAYLGAFDVYGALIVDQACYPCFEGQQPYSVKLDWDPANRLQKIVIELTSHSTPNQRTSAYRLNFGCFTKLGGCADASAFSPDAWDQAHHLNKVSR